MFCPSKDKISYNQKANVIYIIQCPGCHNDYVGKTDINQITRLSEHGKKHVYNSVINNCKTLDSCNNWAILQYLKAYYIKTKSPVISVNLKASKDLQLFK